jgi:hypothetical protein
MQKFINYENFIVPIEQIGNFMLHRDFHTNAIFWDNGECTLYATPEWEEEEGVVALQIVSNEDCSGGFEYSISFPFDLVSQEKEYIRIITEIIEAIESKSFENFDLIFSSINSINSI